MDYNSGGCALAASVIAIILSIVFSVGFASYSCHTKAEKQGMECSWGPIQGCMVKMPDGKWIDYDRLRYMD